MSTRVIKLKQQTPQKEKELFTGKLSLEKTREIWNDEERIYTDDELIRIRDWMYTMAASIIRTARKSRNITTVIPINDQSDEAAQSNSIHPGKHRRAG